MSQVILSDVLMMPWGTSGKEAGKLKPPRKVDCVFSPAPNKGHYLPVL